MEGAQRVGLCFGSAERYQGVDRSAGSVEGAQGVDR